MRKPSLASCWLLTALLVCWFAGCGSEVPKYTAEDHAEGIKNEAMNFVAAARRGEGAGSIEGFLENMQEAGSGPVGEHADTYTQLAEAAEALKGLYESSGSAAQIEEQVNKIASLAEQLPGEVEIDDEEEALRGED